jgi:hypothetical protein
MARKPPKRVVYGGGGQARMAAGPRSVAPLATITRPGAGPTTFRPTVLQQRRFTPAPTYGVAAGLGAGTRRPYAAPSVPSGYQGEHWNGPGPLPPGQRPGAPYGNNDNPGGIAAPPPPGSIFIGGRPNRDISGDILSDFEYAATMRDINAANAADEAAAGENINALAVQWGGDLTDLVKQGLISQQAANAAKNNQFSQMNELQRMLQTGGGQLVNQLAAAGILNSGALPSGTAELNRQYQKETTTGLAERIGQMRNIQAQKLQARAQRQGMLTNAYASVANRLSQDPRNIGTPDMTAYWSQADGAYVDDWGRRYKQDGTRIG